MAEPEPTLPPCGHTDRRRQLTETVLRAENGEAIVLLVCSVPECPEYCRVFADLRDPEETEWAWDGALGGRLGGPAEATEASPG